MIGYIDAATGGMVAAVAAGGLAGLRVAAKSLWYSRRAPAKGTDPAAAGDDATTEDRAGGD